MQHTDLESWHVGSSSLTRSRTGPPALGAGSLSHWTPRAVPSHYPVFPFAFSLKKTLHSIRLHCIVYWRAKQSNFYQSCKLSFLYRIKQSVIVKSIVLVLFSLHQREMWMKLDSRSTLEDSMCAGSWLVLPPPSPTPSPSVELLILSTSEWDWM